MRHRTTIRRTSTIVALLGFLACPCARAGEIVSSGVHAGIVYLLTANPPRVARFDLVAAAWKPSVPVPVGPTALAVGDAGIFVASGRSIARFTLEGTGETHVANLLAPVTTMVVGQRLYVLAAGLLSAVDPASGAVVPVYDIPFFPSLAFKGLALSTERHWLIGLGGSELSRFALAPDGVVIEPPLRAATNGMTATRLTVFPGEARVADDAGLVYHTNDLSSASPVRRDPITFVDPVPPARARRSRGSRGRTRRAAARAGRSAGRRRTRGRRRVRRVAPGRRR